MQIQFPNGEWLRLPLATQSAIASAQAKYTQPLWLFRAEGVLKLGRHQWIYPANPFEAQTAFAAYPHGILCTAWKLFNRSWTGSAENYYLDTANYPNHPRQWGRWVIPLVDEDADGQQIGWAQWVQQTETSEDHAIYVQFLLRDLFAPIPLPAQYR